MQAALLEAILQKPRRGLLGLDFAQGQYSRQGQNFSVPSDIPGWSFSRASVGTALNSAGTIISFATGQPRITDLGILIEEARTNSFLNSAVGVTQAVTTTAGSWTLSFYGTGSITMSGGATGTLNGTGANNRVSLTVTALAIATLLTVSGSCTNVQFEAGAFASSVIVTVGAATTRAADMAAIGSLSLTQPLSLIAEGVSAAGVRAAGDNRLATLEGAGTGNVGLGRANNLASREATDDGTAATSIFGANWNNSTQAKIAARVTSAASAMSFNGAAVQTSVRGTSQTLTNLNLSGYTGDVTAFWNGYIRRVVIYPSALPDAQLQALSL